MRYEDRKTRAAARVLEATLPGSLNAALRAGMEAKQRGATMEECMEIAGIAAVRAFEYWVINGEMPDEGNQL